MTEVYDDKSDNQYYYTLTVINEATEDTLTTAPVT